MANLKGQAFLDKFAEISARVGNQVHLRTLRDSFAAIMPLYILAGIAVLINNVVFAYIWGETGFMPNAEILANAQEGIVDGRVAFADAYPALLDAAGSPLATLYRPGDGLHINDAGYDRVTAVLEPKLRALLAAAD